MSRDYDDEEFVECPRCGGDGAIDWDDAPDMWGDDMGEGLENHLVDCPDCAGKGGWKPNGSAQTVTEKS